MMNVPAATFTGWYKAPATGDLRIAGDVSALVGKGTPVATVTDDYCARARGAAKFDLGALQHSLGDCDTRRPPIGATGGGDAGVGEGGAGDGGVVVPGGDGGAIGSGDGGTANGATPSSDSGCGCRVARPSSSSPIAFAIAFVGAIARRRRTRAR